MIPLRYMLAAMAVIVILAAGCGGTPPPESPKIPSYPALSRLYHVETVEIDGRSLTCLVRESGPNGDTISCDWVAYHDDGSGLPARFRP